MKTKLLTGALAALLISACGQDNATNDKPIESHTKTTVIVQDTNKVTKQKKNARFNIYKEVELKTDLSHLSNNQKIFINGQ